MAAAPIVAMTAKQAAQAVGSTEFRINRAILDGRLRAKQIGEAVRVTPADLAAWVESFPDVEPSQPRTNPATPHPGMSVIEYAATAGAAEVNPAQPQDQ